MDYVSRHAGDKTRKRDLRKDQHEINKKLSCLAGYSIGRKSRFFHIPPLFDAPVSGYSSE